MFTRFEILAAGAALVVSALPSVAQNTSPITFSVGGGFTEPMRYSNGPLNTGYNLTGSLGVRPDKHFGLAAEFGYNHMGISSGTLASLSVPNGSSRIYSLTLQPTVHFNPEGALDIYTTVGGGYYRRTVEFTEPTTAILTGFDPFIGFFPVAVPANSVLGSFTQNKGGINGGVGLAVRISKDSAMRLFAEARYHHIFTSGRDTNYLPVTFGFRW